MNVRLINPWSPGGSFMIQKMAISSPMSAFQWLLKLTNLGEGVKNGGKLITT